MTLSLGILLPSISDDLGLSPSEQGWIGASALIGGLVFALPASLLTRFSPKAVMAASMMMGSGLVVIQAWSPIFAVLFLGRFMFGAIIVARQPARAVLTAQWFPPREIALVNGFIFNFVFGLAAIVGFLATAYLLVWLDDSWRTTLIIFAVVNLVVAFTWIIVGRERTNVTAEGVVESGVRTTLRTFLKYKELWYVALGFLGTSTMFSAIVTFWPTLALDNHDIPLTTSGVILTIDGIAEGVGGLAVSLYLLHAKSKGMRGPLLVLLALFQTSSAVGMVLSGSVPVLVGLSIVHGIGFSIAAIVFTVPFEIPGISHQEIGAAAGLFEMAIRSGGVIGPLLTGFLQEATDDLQISLLVPSLCSLFLIVTAVMVFGKGLAADNEGDTASAT